MRFCQLVILMIVFLVSGISIGWGLKEATMDRYYASYQGNINKQQVLDLLTSYRQNHEFFIQNPDKVGNNTGSVVDNQRLVENYTKIINYVEIAR